MDERRGNAAKSSWPTHPAFGLASAIVCLAALLVLAAYEWRGWHVGLLIWGLAVAAVTVLASTVSGRLALRRMPETPEMAERRRRLRSVRGEINFIILGVGVAVLASGSDWIAVDVVFTVFLVLTLAVSTLAAVAVARRQGTADSPS